MAMESIMSFDFWVNQCAWEVDMVNPYFYAASFTSLFFFNFFL